MPLGPRWAVSLAASTLLDRTWETTTRDTQFVSTDTLASNAAKAGSDGSLGRRIFSSLSIAAPLGDLYERRIRGTPLGCQEEEGPRVVYDPARVIATPLAPVFPA
jgi:hypothetical protein